MHCKHLGRLVLAIMASGVVTAPWADAQGKVKVKEMRGFNVQWKGVPQVNLARGILSYKTGGKPIAYKAMKVGELKHQNNKPVKDSDTLEFPNKYSCKASDYVKHFNKARKRMNKRGYRLRGKPLRLPDFGFLKINVNRWKGMASRWRKAGLEIAQAKLVKIPSKAMFSAWHARMLKVKPAALQSIRRPTRVKGTGPARKTIEITRRKVHKAALTVLSAIKTQSGLSRARRSRYDRFVRRICSYLGHSLASRVIVPSRKPSRQQILVALAYLYKAAGQHRMAAMHRRTALRWLKYIARALRSKTGAGGGSSGGGSSGGGSSGGGSSGSGPSGGAGISRQNYTWEKKWSDTLGNTGTLAVALSASLKGVHGYDLADLTAQGIADAYLFGRKFNVLDGKAYARSERSRVTAGVTIKLVGMTVYDKHWNGNVIEKNGEKKKTFDKSVTFTVVVIIPISVRVGAKGGVGIRYHFGLGGTHVQGSVTPFADLAGYGGIGVDLKFAGGEARVTLTLLELGVTFFGRLGLENSGSKFYLRNQLRITLSVETLKGKVEICGWIYGPKDGWKIWDWVKHEGCIKLFGWDGLKWSTNLLNVDRRINLN